MANDPQQNQLVDTDEVARRRRVSDMLRARGVSPTSQRVAIGLQMLLEPVHLSAEDVAGRVSRMDGNVSRATVYNTLRCFVDHGLVRLVNVGTDRVFYDSNTVPHHHFYDPASGELTDIDSQGVHIVGLPELPSGSDMDSVELVIRVKPARS